MVHRITRTALGAVLAAGLLAAPAAEAKSSGSSRVQVKLRAAERALDRAVENAQDGNSAAALTGRRRVIGPDTPCRRAASARARRDGLRPLPRRPGGCAS